MTKTDKIFKRAFDIIFSLCALIVTGWLILLFAFIVYLENNENGFFTQKRFGKDGKPFTIYKIKTMKTNNKVKIENNRERITTIGKWLRKYKLDELPQFWNVLIGDMSMVGPRPDYPSFAGELESEDRIILSIKPGVTGPASIAYRNEEELLAKQREPEKFSREIIWPEKIKINKKYILEYTFLKDIEYIFKTIF